MRDLLTHPMCKAEDLGAPIPPSEFGVSVCLPRWRDVIGYEEKDPEVLRHFRSGYPRFCCPPAIADLFLEAGRELAGQGELCLVFPQVAHARRCLEFVVLKGGGKGRTAVWRGLGVAIYAETDHALARQFWRFCGEVVSTRQAAEILGRAGCWVSAEAGEEARRTLRKRLAHLSGQMPEDVFLFPSGMAANYAVHRMLTAHRPGMATAQLDFPYVDVLKLQQVCGVGVRFLPLLTDEEYETELLPLLQNESLSGVFVEAPSNPLLRCVNLPLVRRWMDEYQSDVPLVVDDTIATVAHVDAFRFADLTTASLTKSFSGVGDVLAGCVILNRKSRHYAAFSAWMQTGCEHQIWDADAVALERNSRDFPERVEIMSRNALALADWLGAHPKVARVWHPKTDGGPGFESIRREGGGYGCLVSFLLKEATVTSPGFYDRLEVSKGPSLGTNFTLVCPYTLLAHYDELEWTESCGVDRHLIRVSAGLEDTADLIDRFELALS